MKEKTKEKNYYSSDTLTTNSDVLIICIGFAIILLGILGTVFNVPKEFAIGASLAGLFFAISDFITTLEKISEKNVGIYAFCFLFGATSIVAVPAILIMYKTLGDFFVPYADSFSMIALGLVITSIGNRVRKARNDQIEKMNIIIEKLKSNNTAKG